MNIRHAAGDQCRLPGRTAFFCTLSEKKRYNSTMFVFAPMRCFTVLLPLLLLLLIPAVVKCDTIEVKRDAEKTTYSIGSSGDNRVRTEEEKDRERSWDMLNKMNIIIDRDRGTDKKDQEK